MQINCFAGSGRVRPWELLQFLTASRGRPLGDSLGLGRIHFQAALQHDEPQKLRKLT